MKHLHSTTDASTSRHNALCFGAIVFAVMLLCSCSVKEDRRPCPCYIDVTVPELSAEDGDCIVSVFSRDGRLAHRETLSSSSTLFELALPKDFYSGNALWGLSDCALTDSLILIEEGNECDNIYSSITADVNATGEQAHIDFLRHKQFAKLSLSFYTEGRFPYDIALRGEVDGYDLRTLTPHRGAFSVAPQPQDDLNSKFQIRLPRQVDNSLAVVLLNPNEPSTSSPSSSSSSSMGTKTDASEVNVIPLGEIIAQTHYDWTAESLEDIDIVIDFAKAQISIHVSDWDSVIVMRFEI